jgi:hypothetical protein
MVFPLRKTWPCEHCCQKRAQSVDGGRPRIETMIAKKEKRLSADV